MPYGLLVLATLIAYSNIFQNAFVFDDMLLISHNAYLHSWDSIGKIFTSPLTGEGHGGSFCSPLQMLLYMCAYHVGGLSTFWFHCTNLALHIVNVCLLYALGCRMGFQKASLFAATLLWALHPIHTEAVTYMSATADTLCSFFCLAGMVVLLPNFAPRRIAISCAFFVLALLSKEAAIVYPLLVMSLLFYRSDNKTSLRSYGSSLPFWFITALYIAARATILNFDGDAFHLYRPIDAYSENIFYRFYTFLATIPSYLRLFVWPAGLHMERHFQLYESLWTPQVFAGFIICLIAIVTVILGRTGRYAALSWGLLWAMIIFIPCTGILLPLNAVFLEHWMYLPTAGFVIGAGETIMQLLKGKEIVYARWLAISGISVIVFVFCYANYEQNKLWIDPITFYTNIFAHNEPSPRAHNNLGFTYYNQGKYDEAIGQYRLALQGAENYPRAHTNLAIAIISRDDSPSSIDEGVAHFMRAIELNPRFYSAYTGLADLYQHIGDHEKSDYYRARADQLKPPPVN
jgi:tetratricopeptide (TPR) repeat protein